MSSSVLTPTELYEKYPGKFYRLTNETETHHGVTYKTGLNIDPLPFNPSGECSEGGMYFFHEDGIDLSMCSSPQELRWLREVTFPEGARIYVEYRKFKADKFILGEREVIPKWVYMTSISINSSTLGCMDEEMRTYEICLNAVKKNGHALRHVPNDMITKVYLEAVKQNRVAFQYIPKEFRTQEMCLSAVKQNGDVLGYIPKKLITTETCLEAVKQNGVAIRYVPKRLMTAEMCLEAVKRNTHAINYIPMGLMTTEVCQMCSL